MLRIESETNVSSRNCGRLNCRAYSFVRKILCGTFGVESICA